MPIFPNIPNVPGVPTLLRSALTLVTTVVPLLSRDVAKFLVGVLGPQWGIFRGGLPVVIADSVISMEYKQNWSIADYPVEHGGFESYDKVDTPFDVRVRFASGGSELDRQTMLITIASIAATLELFDVVTPERVYQNVNVTHYDYRRTSINGVGLLVVDVWCLELRVSSGTSFINTLSPSGAAPINAGTVQTLVPTQAQSALSGLFH